MITSNNNAKVKQVVQWQTKAKERRKDHVFLAEGIRMCEEAPVKNVREAVSYTHLTLPTKLEV